MENLLIGEVADGADLHVETVRRLEKRGVISSVRDINNWRRFSPEVIKKLRELYQRRDGNE